MLLFLSLLAQLCLFTTAVRAANYTNPLKTPNGSDPFLVTTGGYYYLLTTEWTDVQITRATTLEGLKTGETRTVWSDTTAARCCNVWAPEVHNLNGAWYLYYTAGDSADVSAQHIHVLKGKAVPCARAF